MKPIDQSVYIIAEAGVNHNGNMELALALVDEAVKAGADAVKFQTFKANLLASADVPKAEYQMKSSHADESQLEMLRRLELSEDNHIKLREYCFINNIDFLSTPFDTASLVFLADELKVDQIKLSSGDLTNAPFLVQAARMGKPVVLSTGMAVLSEIEQALSCLAFGYLNKEGRPTKDDLWMAYCSDKGQAALQRMVTVLHCTTEYPAPYDEVNLSVMDTISQAFGLRTGYSDHTRGISVSIAAAARGAKVIEKHFTLDKTLTGPDHKASLEPQELQQMVHSIREVEQAIGKAVKMPSRSEWKNMNISRKSIVAARDIEPGEIFTEDNLICKRAGAGISPFDYWEMIGKSANRAYRKDELIEK